MTHSTDVTGTALVYTGDLFDTKHAKTAHGLVRGSNRFDILGLIDKGAAGQDAGLILEGRPVGVMGFASLADYRAQYPDQSIDFLLVGIAVAGGQLPNDLRAGIVDALQQGISVVCGLHTFLSEDEELVALAERTGARLIDVRKPKHRSELHFWTGDIYGVQAARVAVLGTDCAVGKRTTCKLLLESCQRAGMSAEMIYTGQTGWMQGFPYGFIFDSTVNDFVSGELEHAVVQCDRERQPDLILMEGQSALRNPSGPCGAEFLLSADAKGVILQHIPCRENYKISRSNIAIPDIADEIKLIEMYGSQVLAVTLNEFGLEASEVEPLRQRLQERLGLPVVRPLAGGTDELIPVLSAWIAAQRD